MTPQHPTTGMETALDLVRPGMTVAVPPEYCGVALAATRGLIRRATGDLHLVTVPQSGLQADLMIGAGLVKVLETSAVSMGELGAAPRFTAAVAAGEIGLLDSTCPAIHAQLQAAEKGIPFIPLRGLIGTDVLKHRRDWQVRANPFADDDTIVLLPALRPDIALFHCEMADREGNLWIGRRRELATMAHAAKATIATVEEIFDGDLMADEQMAAGALSSVYVDVAVLAPGGARPLAMPGYYEADRQALADYVAAAATAEGFAAWLERHVLAADAA